MASRTTDVAPDDARDDEAARTRDTSDVPPASAGDGAPSPPTGSDPASIVLRDAPAPASPLAVLNRWRPPGERVLLALLLAGAALVRLVGLGQLEPNVSTAELGNLAGVQSVLAGQQSSLLSWVGAGASGLALLPSVVLLAVHPEPEIALRVYAALGSLAMVGLFYALCRTQFPPVVSLGATGLLAFSPWSIVFGRAGELEAFAGAFAVGAALTLQRALAGGGPRSWLLAGALSTAGLYWHPSALWVLPALTVPIVWAIVEHAAARSRLVVALCVFLAGGLLVAAPRVPSLIQGPISTSAWLATEGAQGEPPALPRVRGQQAVRAFFLLDPTTTGEKRYQEEGRAPLDGLTGVLMLCGLALVTWHLPTRVLPASLFLLPLIGSQLASPRVPSLADAAIALPGLYLLVAEALAGALAVAPFPSIARAAVLVAIPTYALFGWQAYSGWIGTASSAQARQPALDYDEIDPWIGELQTRLAAGQPAISAQAWRADHPRLTAGSRVVRRPRNSAPPAAQIALAQLSLRQTDTIPGETGQRAPRILASGGNGAIFASDASGRISRLELDRNVIMTLPPRTPPLEQISDMASDAEGNMYLADAERSVLVRLSPTGEIVGTFGAEWGMYRPRGLTVGPDGRIYVADTGRNRIAVGTPDGRFQKSITPSSSFGAFEQPTDVAVDASGRIFVGLPEISRLAILDESGQVLGGWSIPKGNTIESSRLAVVADGAIAMTDPAEGKVRLYDADGRELAIAAVPGRPYGATVANGQLFVADPASGRVIRFSLGSP
ncbi:MAG: glycosyltransferase family 39 protein [Chloroflexota bacterium]